MSIILEGITKIYGDVVALDNINLVVEQGEFFSVFGPPSSGKSVLLRILLGLEKPDAGRITIDGKDVTLLRPRERNLSMIFQNLALFPTMSAKENIIFPLKRRGFETSEIEERLEKVIHPLGIEHILHKKPAQLSGGERQRVALGRCLIRSASAYLMDEPIAALDARLRETMRVELSRLQREHGNTFIYVTHDYEEAMSVADRMAILEDGRIVQNAPPDDIYSQPSSLYVAKLIGSPPINVLDGVWRENSFIGDHGKIKFNGLSERNFRQSKMSLAFRPEVVRSGEIHGSDNSFQLEGTVSDIESLGAYSVATVGVGKTDIRIMCPGHNGPSPNEKIVMQIPTSGLLAFDDASGNRINNGTLS